MANEILAALQGLLQGVASGAIDRVTFDQKLKEEAGKARLLESQIRSGQVDPSIGGALGKRAMGAGITGADGQQVTPQTTQEATLLQGATGQEQNISFKKSQEEARTKREKLRADAHSAVVNAKSLGDLEKDINREINTRIDNERAIIQARMGGIMTPEGEAELRKTTEEIKHDVRYEFNAAWALQKTKVGLMESPHMDGKGVVPEAPKGPQKSVGSDLERYLKDISTMTPDTIKAIKVPTKYQNNLDVINAFRQRLTELGISK